MVEVSQHDRWVGNAQLFREFVAEHGHPNVPQKLTVDGVKLGIWLGNQRQKYRRGDLATELSAALFGIHPEWLSSTGRAAQWEASAQLFREFVAEHGHPNVPSRLTVDGVKLGAWLSRQRQKYRRGDLTSERAAALFDIHPKWVNTIRRSENWETDAALFREFVAEHGHPHVPRKFTADNVKLGIWLNNMAKQPAPSAPPQAISPPSVPPSCLIFTQNGLVTLDARHSGKPVPNFSVNLSQNTGTPTCRKNLL